MTEEEAQQKACCGPRNNAETSLDSDVLCIASRCMAWRWELVHDGSFNTALGGPRLEVTERVPNFVRSDRGFCGLAGQPA